MDGKTWQAVKDNLDKAFSAVGPARYEYRLKCQLEGSARLRHLAIRNDIQMAPLSLPEMVVGDNRFTYTDESSRRPTDPDHAPLGRTLGLAAATGPGGSRLSGRWRGKRGHRRGVPVGAGRGPRR